MTEALLPIVQKINGYLSDYILVALLIAVGLWYSIKTRFVQIRCFKEGWNSVFGNLSLRGKKHDSGMSSFQALATAIAAQVGTGNIVGASGAILTGGPGAIFWMWVIAFFGMATIYAEATLAIKTRIKAADGTIHGGPVYYITTAFKGGFGKFLATLFAVAIILALGFMGCMVQSNSIAETMNTAFGIPTWVMGLIVVILAGTVFIGGVSRLAAVTEKIVPIMAVLYVLGSLVVLIMNAANIPATFALIFQCAFSPQAGIGGAFFGIVAAITYGAKRGLFSNEAGMGSTPHAHALANVKSPHEQGTVAMIGVFIDTFVVLTMTALVVISTLYVGDGALAKAYEDAGKYDTVIEFVMARDINNLPAGKTRISGDKAVVTVCTVTPQTSDKALFQRRDNHLTLETDLEGSELFEVSLGELTPTKPTDEAADLTVGTAGTSIAGMLCEGRFALYLAGEPYKSGLKAQGCGKLKKAVFSIELDEDEEAE